VHLTVQFIGDVPARDLGTTRESVRRSAAGIDAFVLRPLSLEAWPDVPASRLLAIVTDAPPPLLELHRRLARRFARRPRRDPAGRYRPHLTIVRFRGRQADASPASALLGVLPADDAGAAPFEVRELRLERSVLDPSGARYETIETVCLA